jgi:hypothetical protein
VLEESAGTSDKPQKQANDKEGCLLLRMSKQNSFSLFRKVILVSNPNDQYVPFHSARIQVSFWSLVWSGLECLLTYGNMQTTSKMESEAANESNSGDAYRVRSMVHNLMDALRPDQLLRVTVVNYNSAIHVPPRFDDKTGKSQKEKKHDASNTNEFGSLLMKEYESSVFDVNRMIGRSAHICYLESPTIALQLIMSLQKYFVNQHMP